MNTLRAKLTALLVGAILLVVALATGLLFVLLPGPDFAASDRAIAEQIDLLARALDSGQPAESASGAFGIHPQAAGGPVDRGPTEGVSRALRQIGRPEAAIVSMPLESASLIVSVKLAEGRWLLVPMPGGPPRRDGLLIGAGWMLVIALGTTIVIVLAVRRFTEPLALLERTVARIGPDGELEPLAETGPAEVKATARAINLLSARLKNAMESRMRLVAAAGHDLRTPMTRMRLRAEFLGEEDRVTWIADLDELDRIADSAIRLVREEVEGSPRELIRLDALVDEIAGELVETGHAVSIVESEPVAVLGRLLSLKRALRNLVANAATHGHGAEITVRSEGGAALMVIADRGPGIPDALMERVFEPFFRVDPARGAPIPGAGLGLAIAHEIITRHGGTLTLHNRADPPGGLEQHVRLERLSG